MHIPDLEDDLPFDEEGEKSRPPARSCSHAVSTDPKHSRAFCGRTESFGSVIIGSRRAKTERCAITSGARKYRAGQWPGPHLEFFYRARREDVD